MGRIISLAVTIGLIVASLMYVHVYSTNDPTHAKGSIVCDGFNFSIPENLPGMEAYKHGQICVGSLTVHL